MTHDMFLLKKFNNFFLKKKKLFLKRELARARKKVVNFN